MLRYPIKNLADYTSLLAALFFCTSALAWQIKPSRPTLGPDTNIIRTMVYGKVTKREGSDLQIPVPPREHPRLFIRRNDLALLKAKMSSPLLKDCWGRILSAASTNTTNYITAAHRVGYDLKLRDAIEAKALLFVLNGDIREGQEAVAAVIDWYRVLTFDTTKADVTRDVGRAIVTGALVYDWCYPLLLPAQKQALIGSMETFATQMEIKWPLLNQSSVTGHGAEAQLSRDMLACGVAAYDEKPEIYNRVAGRIMAEFVPARKFFYPASYHHQGSAYGPYRFSWDMVATFIFDKLGYPKIFGPDQAKVPYYFIYTRRPDGQLFRNGDDFNELFLPFGKYWSFGSTSNSYTGSYFKDPILLREALKEGPLGKDSDYLFDFLICDGDVTSNATKSSLPLTSYFKEPFGAMVARTGWKEGITAPDVIAEMKVGVYNFVNHQHLDAGSFQVYCKGPLTVQSGIYQGTNGAYGSDHFINYSQRSIAHNTLLIYNPNEKFTWQGRPVSNDGGQKFPNGGVEPKTLEDLLGHNYKTGEVLAHDFGPDAVAPEYSYLKGEIAPAYSDKVKSCRRSFVFLHLTGTVTPAALIVFDDITTTSKDFKTYFLLHCVEEPLIEGDRAIIKRTQKGYDGKMINTTLIPGKDNIMINKAGGAGNEFSVFGKNFPQAIARPAAASWDSAIWRIEISPARQDSHTNFLNVLQITDSHATQEQIKPPEKIETARMSGVKMEDRIVLFSKNGELIKDRIDLSVKGNGNYKVLITDVQQGNWKIKKTGVKTDEKILKNDQQLLYFTVKQGEYIISKN